MTDAASVPSVSLAGGVEIPQLGIGVFQIAPEQTQALVEAAFNVGYRHVDTAAAYCNEKGVGSAITASGLSRNEVFVTTKLWNSEQGFDSTMSAFEASRRRLGLYYVDLRTGMSTVTLGALAA